MQDSSAYTGQIKMFAGNFAPQGWALCNGALLVITQYEALFSLIGNNFGGDGRTNFALPDMRGRIPLHYGQSPGTSAYPFAMTNGTEAVTLTTEAIPPHNHPMQASTDSAGTIDPGGAIIAKTNNDFYAAFNAANTAEFLPEAVSSTGNGVPHSNMMPYLCINFIICLSGLYPPRP